MVAAQVHTGVAPGATVGFWAAEELTGTRKDVLAHRPRDYWLPRDVSAYSPDVWAVLERNRSPLFVNLRFHRDFGATGRRGPDDALPLLRAAAERGIPLWAWLVVPYADGYWAYDGNAALYRTAIERLCAWARDLGLHLQGLVIDSEMSLAHTGEVLEALRGDPARADAIGRESIDPEEHSAAVRTYREAITWVQRQGPAVAAACYPLVLDDLDDGTCVLQDSLGIVSVPPDEWDRLFFMAYRSIQVEHFGNDGGSALVASYAKSARARFGARGEITLGVAGDAPYDVLDEMVFDVRMLAGLGAKTVPIYSLERMVASFGVAGLAAVIEAGCSPLDAAQMPEETMYSQGGRGVVKSFVRRAASLASERELEALRLPLL